MAFLGEAPKSTQYICSIQMSVKPHDDLSNVPSDFEAGYIRVKNSETQLNSLFYVARSTGDKKKKPICTELNDDDETLKLYDSVIPSSAKLYPLNSDELDAIVSILLNPTKEIERLVFVGGGAKGVIYPGAYAAVVDTGAFDNVQMVSGSSVGSISAAMIAVGITPERLRQLMDTNLAKLMGNRVGKLFGNHDGVNVFTRSGDELLDFIRCGIIETVQQFLAKLKEEAIEKDYPDLLPLIDKCAQSSAPTITFHDLNILNHYFPNQFKQLAITGVKLTLDRGADLQIFNAKLTPNVEIAEACRGSCSLPVYLHPVSINIDSQDEMIVDGGLYDNIPTDYFDGVDEAGHFIPNKKKAKTLVFGFNDVATRRALYGNPAIEPFKSTLKHRFKFGPALRYIADIAPMWSPMRQKQEGYRRLQGDYPLRTVQLRVTPVQTRSYALATTLSREMYSLGYLDAVTSITNLGVHDCTSFSPEFFYLSIVENFIHIYSAVLVGAGKNPAHDVLIKQLNAPNISMLTRYHLIRDSVTAPQKCSYWDFCATNDSATKIFALSRAVEFYKDELSAEDLFKETYQESFKRSGFFSVSKIAGECIFKSSTLKHKLENKRMFCLFDKRNNVPHSNTRAGLVFDSLSKINKFSSGHKEHIETPNSR